MSLSATICYHTGGGGWGASFVTQTFSVGHQIFQLEGVVVGWVGGRGVMLPPSVLVGGGCRYLSNVLGCETLPSTHITMVISGEIRPRAQYFDIFR